jgi:uncharacterized protein (DUF58 family)
MKSGDLVFARQTLETPKFSKLAPMNLKLASQLFSFRDLRNAILGVIVVFGGLGLSGLTLYAHQEENYRLAAIAASASLVFVLLILVFVVPPLAKNAGREASQLNLPFEFTTGGAILLVLLLIVGFSAWNTGNNLLFLVLSFLLAAMVIGFVAGSLCLKKLDVTMRFPETIFAGEKTPILVSMHNRKRLVPAFSVVVEVRGKERERSIAAEHLDAALPKWIAKRLGQAPVVRRTLDHFVYVAGKESVEKKAEHTFLHRGRLSIRDFELSTKFPFGFFRHRRRLPAREAELIVFPQMIDVSSELETLPLDAGDRVSAKRGSGQDLLSLRTYQPQDDLRRIDWKATARTRQLTVREFAADDERRITIIFDPRVGTDPADLPIREKIAAEQAGKPVVASPRFEHGTSLAASLLSHFAVENAQIRLIIGDQDTDFSTGRAHLHEALRKLALLEPQFAGDKTPTLDLDTVLNDTDDSHCLLITANENSTLSPELTQKVKVIRF